MKKLKDIAFSLAAFCVSLSMQSCILLTDASTRLAYDIRSAALELESSDLEKLEIEHKPKSWPSGVDGDFTIVIQTTDTTIKPNGALAVGKYATTYHRRFVKVPKTFQITKKEGESVFLLLVKTNEPWTPVFQGETLRGNKTIEIVSIR